MAESYNELFGKGKHSPDPDCHGSWLCQETSGTSLADDTGVGPTLISSVDISTATEAGPIPGGYLANAYSAVSGNNATVASSGTWQATTFLGWINRRTGFGSGVRNPIAGVEAGDPYIAPRVRTAADPDCELESATNITGPTVTDRWGNAGHTAGTWDHFSLRTGVTPGLLQTLSGTVDPAPSSVNTVGTGSYNRIWFGTARRYGGGTNLGNFNGGIAGFALFNRRLTDAEVDEHRLGPEPLNVVPPSITGTPSVGETLSADSDVWDSQSNGIVVRSYQWYRADDELGTNEAPIAGATAKTYVVDPADDGKHLRVLVRGDNDGGYDPLESTFSDYVQVGEAGEVATADSVDATTDITQPSLSVSVSVSAEGVTSATDITQPSTGVAVTVDADNVTSATDITEPGLSIGVSVNVESVDSATDITQPTVVTGSAALANNVDSTTDITQPSLSVSVSVVADSLEVLASVDSPTWQVDVSVTAEGLLGATFISDPFAFIGVIEEASGCEAYVRKFPAHSVLQKHPAHSQVTEEHK